MESNNYEWFITQTVEAMLPRFSDDELCLTMKLEMVWEYISDDGETRKRFRRDVLLAFHRPHNYTKVLYREVKEPFRIESEAVQMNCLSDHDSCWRSDGMQWIFQAFMDAWDYFELHDIDGRKIDPHFHYSIFGGKPSYRKCLLEPIRDRYNVARKYNVVFGKEIPMCQISKYMPKPEEF